MLPGAAGVAGAGGWGKDSPFGAACDATGDNAPRPALWASGGWAWIAVLPPVYRSQAKMWRGQPPAARREHHTSRFRALLRISLLRSHWPSQRQAKERCPMLYRRIRQMVAVRPGPHPCGRCSALAYRAQGYGHCSLYAPVRLPRTATPFWHPTPARIGHPTTRRTQGGALPSTLC